MLSLKSTNYPFCFEKNCALKNYFMDKTIEITDLTELNRIKNIRKQTIEASFAEIKSRQALKERE